MQNRQYIMRDQVRNRVDSIMADKCHGAEGRWRDGPRDLLLTLVMTGLYAAVLGATA